MLKSTCNKRCDCVETEYHPVCAELTSGKQIAFFSPCFAGCEEKYDSKNKVVFVFTNFSKKKTVFSYLQYSPYWASFSNIATVLVCLKTRNTGIGL